MKLVYRATLSLYYLIIVIISVSPGIGIVEINSVDFSFRFDYFLHTLVFVPIPILAYLSNSMNCSSWHWKVLLLIGAILAIGSEFLQLLTSTRVFNPFDMIFNLFGLSLGIIIARLWCRSRAKAKLTRR
jgi:glycopeptide antibiotics resistance protein